MFLPEESFSEINKAFVPSKPLEPIDKENILQNMNSLYELEDYIKEKIYDIKYPGVLPAINHNLSSPDEYSDEDEQNNSENIKEVETSNNNIESVDKKYKIESKSSDVIIFNSNNYSTNDEDEFSSIEILNEDRSEGNRNGWCLSSEQNDIKIHNKIIKVKNEDGTEYDSLAFYAEIILDVNSSKFVNYLNDINFRKEFDNLYQNGKIIQEIKDENNEIKSMDIYLYLKMPFFYTDRDFVVRKKIWKDYDNKKGCYLIHMKSVKINEYPEQTKPVRGEFIIRTGYICPIEGDENKCKLYLVTSFDIKMSAPIVLLRNLGSDGQKKWSEKLIQNINDHEK